MVGFEPNSVQLTKFEYGFASASSGVLTRIVCQPFDVVKIRFQLQLEPIKKGSAAKYTSIAGAFAQIPREEGARALWKGLIPAQLLSVAFNTSQFVAFEVITRNVFPLLPAKLQMPDMKPATHFLCGAMAGCTATAIAQPLDVLRTRFVAQGEPRRYTSISQALVMLIKEEGFLAMYKGLIPTLIQIGPQTGCQFGFYAILTSLWAITFAKSEGSLIGPTESLVCGATAGMSAKAVVYPLDMIKKRLQVQGFEGARKGFGQTRHYNGVLHCIADVFKTEGARGLFKGLAPSLLKSAVASGVNFCLYEQVCNVFRISHMTGGGGGAGLENKPFSPL